MTEELSSGYDEQQQQQDHNQKQLLSHQEKYPKHVIMINLHQPQSTNGGGGGGGRISLVMGFAVTALSYHRHFLIFIAITLMTTLPYSLLLHSFSHSSQSLLDEIAFEASALPRLSPGLGSRHVSNELTAHVVKFLLRKACYALLLFVLSLLSTASFVHAASTVYLRHPPPSLRSLASSIRGTWPRIASTSMVVYVLSVGFDLVARIAKSAIHEAPLLAGTAAALVRGVIAATWAFLSVVGSLGMVVSVMEERYGMEALVGAWDLLERRRFPSWVMGGFQAALSGCVGWCWWRFARFVGVGSLCMVILLTDVMFTVFYLECKRRPQPDSSATKLKLEETL